MKPSEYPRLREKKYKGKRGQTYTYYVWDGRTLGMKDIRLGTDRDRAIELWAQCEKGIFPAPPPRARKIPVFKKKREKLGRIGKFESGTKRYLDSESWMSQPQWVRTMFYNAERRARTSGKSFNLSPETFLRCVERASGRCEVSGIAFVLDEKRSPFAPSLDRIDSSIGYDPGNVRIVCHVANVSMNTWGMGPVITLVESFLRQRCT